MLIYYYYLGHYGTAGTALYEHSRTDKIDGDVCLFTLLDYTWFGKRTPCKTP